MDEFKLVFPGHPIQGCVATFVIAEHEQEFRELIADNSKRTFKVRGIISGNIPVTTKLESLLSSSGTKFFRIEPYQLSLRIFRGGMDREYYDLIGERDGKLKYVEVEVKTTSSRDAVLQARGSISRLLDYFCSALGLAFQILRLEVVSFRGDYPLMYDILMPNTEGIVWKNSGGVLQSTAFIGVDALMREALCSPSPFYKFLCLFRLYESTTTLRKWMRETCRELNIDAQSPPSPKLDISLFSLFGLKKEFFEKAKNADQLFQSLKDKRNAVAHYILDEDQSHLLLSDGYNFYEYTVLSSLLMFYVTAAIRDLKEFYLKNLHIRITEPDNVMTLRDRSRFDSDGNRRH